MAALTFASDTLKPGGHFVCKFYQGSEDKAFENLLKKMFAKVHREKPESSRSVGFIWYRGLNPANYLGITRGVLCRFEEERRRYFGGYPEPRIIIAPQDG